MSAQNDALELLRITSERDLQVVMGLPEGRRLMWRILDQFSGTLNGSFVVDPHATAFNEGRRKVGLDLTAELQRAVPEAYVHMLSEELTRRRDREREEQAAKQDERDD